MPFLERVLRGEKSRRSGCARWPRTTITSAGAARSTTSVAPSWLRCAPSCTRRPAPAGLLGKPQLAPLPGRHDPQMAGDGVERALAFVTSAFGSYSGCRQYLEDIARARSEVGPRAPAVDKLRGFHNHPGFVEPLVESVTAALGCLAETRRESCRLVFTAHSIPRVMAASSPYEAQLRETAGLVASALGDPAGRWHTRAAADPRPALAGAGRARRAAERRGRRRQGRRGGPDRVLSPITWRWSTISISRLRAAHVISVSRW